MSNHVKMKAFRAFISILWMGFSSSNPSSMGIPDTYTANPPVPFKLVTVSVSEEYKECPYYIHPNFELKVVPTIDHHTILLARRPIKNN